GADGVHQNAVFSEFGGEHAGLRVQGRLREAVGGRSTAHRGERPRLADTFTTRACRLLRSSGKNARTILQAPNRLVSRASRTWARSASAARCQVSYRMAALFTSTSSRPNSRSTRARVRSMLFTSVTSSWQGRTMR